MSASLATTGRMTVEQYLDWSLAQPKGRYELVAGVPHRMSPERNQHALVKVSVYLALREAVAGTRVDCVVFPDGPTIVINPTQAREPDVSVQLGAFDPDAMTIDAPVIVVEVTSPSTMRTDTQDKLIEYFSLASIRHYLVVHPAERKVVHHRRDDGGRIETSIVAEGSLRFDPPGFSVEIARFFEDLPPVKAH